MSTIYRVQHEKSGLGPYYWPVNDSVNGLIEIHDNSREVHPIPGYDKDVREIKDYELCGFSSLEQLNKWFTAKELILLGNNGYEIIKLDNVKITCFGKKQVIFIPSLTCV